MSGERATADGGGSAAPATYGHQPLIALVGQTATGKSALAIELAERFGGELVCADSRTVYRGMDIGTAKPTPADRERVPHWGLDLVTPDQRFTAADFKTYANDVIDDIHSRGKLPILVGGSGLYIDAVLYDFSFRPPASEALRAELNALEVEALQARIEQAGLEMPRNRRNPRHLVRVLETGGAAGGRGELRADTLVLGLAGERDELAVRIAQRVDAMVGQGLVDEVRRLAEQYGWDAPGLQAPGYKELHAYAEGTITLDEMKRNVVQSTVRLAKRQKTWFKRNKSIQWLSTPYNLVEAVDITTTFLNN